MKRCSNFQQRRPTLQQEHLLYVDVRQRKLRWTIKMAHLTTVSTNGAPDIESEELGRSDTVACASERT